MTPADLKHRLLRLLRVESPGTAPSYIQDDVTIAVNAAYQTLWLDVPETRRSHYTRRIDTVALTAGTHEYVLDDDVANVLGPIYRVTDSEPLMPLASKHDFLNYGPIAKGLAQAPNGPPEAYYLDRRSTTADAGTETRLFIAPTPAADVSIEMEVEIRCPRFATADFCADVPPKLQIPQEYVESTLLPVATWYAAGSHWFTDRDGALTQRLQSEATRALARMGVTDPQQFGAEKSHSANHAAA